MDDSASAQCANNSIEDKIVSVKSALSDLQNLAYLQYVVLYERGKNSDGHDVLITLHHSIDSRLGILHDTCGTLFDALAETSAPAGQSAKAKRSVFSGPQVNSNIVSLD